MNHFSNLAEVIEYFNSEEKCRTTLEKMRWPDKNIICPKCGAEKSYRMGDMIHYKCRDKKCGTRFSVIRGTIFEATKLPLKKWFIAMYLLTAHKKGISSHQLARDLGIVKKPLGSSFAASGKCCDLSQWNYWIILWKWMKPM